MEFVRGRRLLLVLDNCEHMTQACADARTKHPAVGPERQRCSPRAASGSVSAGSRRIRCAPFRRAARAGRSLRARLREFASVRLFSERAIAARPDFAITDENASAVAAICQQLDGIPLALELAAARVRSMSVQRIADRLSDRFKLLSTGDRTSLPRQRTLRALIDWSYDLLSVEEQVAFRRLSVFAGGFTLEAAEAVAAAEPIATSDVLDLVAELVEKSLVILDAGNDRYRMLETVRQYGARQVVARRERGDTASFRHALRRPRGARRTGDGRHRCRSVARAARPRARECSRCACVLRERQRRRRPRPYGSFAQFGATSSAAGSSTSSMG